MNFKIDDKVIIKTREATVEDIESQTYFNFFGGLKGIITKLPVEGLCCISIDIESLKLDFLQRHKEIEKLERDRWLKGLSEEQRRNMTAEQKKYHLDYTLLVKVDDIELLNE